MRIFYKILIGIGIGLLIYNTTQLNNEPLFEGDNLTTLITIMALVCAIILLLILITSKQIQNKQK